MSRDTDRIEALRVELVRALVAEAGMREVVALPIADSLLAYLQREHGGERLYIPQPCRQYDVLQIEAALKRGWTVARVCREFSISRASLYRLFPDGLPSASSNTGEGAGTAA